MVLDRLSIQATDVNIEHTPDMGVPPYTSRRRLSDSSTFSYVETLTYLWQKQGYPSRSLSRTS